MEDAFDGENVISPIPTPKAVGTEIIDNGIHYLVTSSNTVQVGDNTGQTYSGDLVIPASITSDYVDYAVTAIAAGAFYENSTITSVTIGENIETIGDWAFCKVPIAGALVIPDAVTTIGNYAFMVDEQQAALTSLVLGSGLTSIGNAAFAGQKYIAGAVVIPATVTSIGTSAFVNCYAITSINIPDGITTIGATTFSGCSSLTSIDIPASVASIGQEAFVRCANLTSLTIGGSPVIGVRAFATCQSLKTITLLSMVPPTFATTNAGTQGNNDFAFRHGDPAPTGGSKNDPIATVTHVYVPTGSLSAYQTAWSWWSAQISEI
ncbi:MAG: leucine-rich repeat domain-containing protein [Prevotella sp.]|nr:leucine-rich repeat domain-containing protein [Prevotella sp.]